MALTSLAILNGKVVIVPSPHWFHCNGSMVANTNADGEEWETDDDHEVLEDGDDVMMTGSEGHGGDREERAKARRGRRLVETLVRSHREITFTHKARMYRGILRV